MMFIGMLFLGTITLLAQNEESSKFKVSGKCDMCKARIEKAATSVEGVTSADWNKKTEMIEVTYDDSKTDIHKIHLAIAEAGHDTEMHKASDEAYAKLPSCCKYREDGQQDKAKEKGKEE